MSTYMANCIKACHWDEFIPMGVANPSNKLVQGPPFLQLIRKTSIILFEYNSPNPTETSLEQDLTALIATYGSSHAISIEAEAFGGVLPSAELLQKLGFQINEGGMLRVKDISGPTFTAGMDIPALGLLISKVTPEDALWEQRISIESALFGYEKFGDGTYVANLRVALRNMWEQGDQHYLVLTESGEAVGYMTMRYRHGVAYLQGAGVLEAFRKKGITRKLLNVCVVEAQQKGFDRIVTVGHDAPAESAWAAMGFTELLGRARSYRRQALTAEP
ncbi:hypothetical protein CcCBS67573_g01574 [Chytriomyces confervae]|uniref:N-acetyltransferase domain-containing protein n=1 Tax=Chytriomyces confervae TaxID=246404 RepID=A0A507FN83_9FUNG|nr:hypothetical protein HDU80_009515 [Chytriomyces hyalinus]TPX77150.1 hypothetical protein CcCBS67573_g01574 [Chytriomyces confervae]